MNDSTTRLLKIVDRDDQTLSRLNTIRLSCVHATANSLDYKLGVRLFWAFHQQERSQLSGMIYHSFKNRQFSS